ncbi:hypothetical protein TRVL_04703 [Trypanosoma vivax]|nr:hypothetical protein TRVL_04703 [Trypanosoma vivax]
MFLRGGAVAVARKSTSSRERRRKVPKSGEAFIAKGCRRWLGVWARRNTCRLTRGKEGNCLQRRACGGAADFWGGKAGMERQPKRWKPCFALVEEWRAQGHWRVANEAR